MTEVKDNFGQKLGGWTPDIPDKRDLTPLDLPAVLRNPLSAIETLEDEADLSEFFPAAESQRDRRATVAYACGSLVEYFNRRCLGRLARLSKPFLYDVTRRLEGVRGDNSVSIRATLKAVRRVGLPPASCVSTDGVGGCDLSLDPLLYAFSTEYNDIAYFRIDTPELNPCQRLDVVRKLLQLGIPTIFGMPLLSCHSRDPRVDFRIDGEVVGGAAGVFVGYDNAYRMSSVGALRFLSSWGSEWGENGFGWLSYRFMEEGLVRDIWAVFDPKWSEHGDLPITPRHVSNLEGNERRLSTTP